MSHFSKREAKLVKLASSIVFLLASVAPVCWATVPSGSLISPTSNQVYTQQRTMTMNATLSDVHGVTFARFYVRPDSYPEEQGINSGWTYDAPNFQYYIDDYTAPYSATWYFDNMKDKTFTVILCARDNGGSFGEVTRANNVKCKNAPDATWSTPSNGQIITNGRIDMAANASDPQGIQWIRFYVYGRTNNSQGSNSAWSQAPDGKWYYTDSSSPWSATWNTAGLPDQQYDLYIWGQDANGSYGPATTPPDPITVTVQTPTPPTINVSPTSLSPTCNQGSNATNQNSFTVRNSGGGTLSYSFANLPTWISSVSPSTGSLGSGSSINHTIYYSTSTQLPGTYNASVAITASGATNTPQYLGITLTVYAINPVIGCTSALYPSCTEGSNATNGTPLQIWNSAGGTLSYNISDNQSWLSVSPTSGSVSTGTNNHAITYTTSGLGTGNYSATITITGNGTNSPQYAYVYLTVYPPPAPPAPTLSSPGNNTEIYSQPTFRWNAVTSNPAVTGYHLQVLADGGGLVYDNSGLGAGTTSINVALPSPNKYWWRVRAKNGTSNWGSWSGQWAVFYKTPVNLTPNQNKQGFSKEPVNTATGAYTYSRSDLTISGRGLPLEFSRFYNSRTAATTAMGAKWRHTYLVTLEEQGDLTVVIHWANCTDDFYAPLGGGQYRNAYFGYSGRLTKNGDGSFDFRTKNLTTYHFNAARTLTSISDRNANALSLTYDGSSRLSTVTDTVGRVFTLEYDGAGKLTRVADSIARELTFTYSGDDLASVTDLLGNFTNYSYDTNHNLLQIQDARGNVVVTNVYDTDNRVTSQTNGRGKTWTYAYTLEGVTTETDPATPTNGITIYEYNAMSWLVKRTDARGNFEQYAYDADGNLTERTNARGYKTTLTYDAHGNVLTVKDPLENITTYEYNAEDQVTLVRDAIARETLSTYDTHENLLTVTRPLGHIIAFEYDAQGQPTKMTDARANDTTYTYDGQGNRQTAVNALGETTQFAYDPVGRLTSIIEPNTAHTDLTYYADDALHTVADQENHVTLYEYDANHNRTKIRNPRSFEANFTYTINNLVETVTDPEGHTATQDYDDLDRLGTLTDRRGKVFRFQYDAVGNLTKTTDPYNAETQNEYDYNANRTKITNANGHAITITFDELDRPKTVSDALGNVSEYSYDSVGRMTAVKDANLKDTTYTYDDLDRLIQIEEPLHGAAKFEYDLNGNRTAVTDPKDHTTTFEYDELNRLNSEKDALDRVTGYTYDTAGNLLTRTDAKSNVTTYAYLLNHRLHTITYPGGATVTFAYDENGNRTQMVDPSGTTAWQFDSQDRITQVTDPSSNVVGYGYDNGSNRTGIVYPGTKSVTYTFDDDGRLESLTDWAGHTFTYSYDAAGNMTQLDYPNGCKQKRTYYDNERLKTLAHEKPDASQFVAYTYYYDGIGNITKMDRKEAVDREFAAESTAYTYDAANQILTAGIETFTFDANGNQLSKTSPNGTTNYTYDYENRLVQVQEPGGASTQFAYNAVGDRLSSTEGGAQKRFLLDLNKPLTDVLADLDASSQPQQFYLYGLGLVGRVTPSGDLVQYHPDHIGSIMAVTDQTNNVTAAYAYDEFGAVARQSGSEAGPWRFCGEIGLQETANGVHFVRARYYDNTTGRFLAHDPLLQTLGTQRIHPYVYVENSPVSRQDPSGEFANILAGAGIGGVVGASMDLIGQFGRNGGDITSVNWGSVGGNFISGAATGAFLASGVGLVGAVVVGAGGAVLGHAAEVQINQNIGAYAPNYQYGNQTNNVSDYLWSAGTGAVSGALGKVFSEVLPRQMKLPLNVSDKIYNDAIRYGLFQEGSKFALDQNLAIIQDTLFDPMASAIGRYATSSLTQSSKSSTCNSTEASLGMPLQNANSTPAFLY